MRGFVAICRELWDDVDFRDAEMSQREAWVWMIAHATWKEREIRVGANVVKLERGQLAYSTRYLAGVFQWSEARVRRYFDMLKNRRMVQTETDAGVTVITICKYDDYQSVTAKADAPATQQATQERRTSDANKNQDNQDNHDISREADFCPELISQLWNEICHQLHPVNNLSLDRENKIINLMQSTLPSEQKWRDFFRKISGSSYLRGEVQSFQATFDWVINPRNSVKILDGNYDDREPSAKVFDAAAYLAAKHRKAENVN